MNLFKTSDRIPDKTCDLYCSSEFSVNYYEDSIHNSPGKIGKGRGAKNSDGSGGSAEYVVRESTIIRGAGLPYWSKPLTNVYYSKFLVNYFGNGL